MLLTLSPLPCLLATALAASTLGERELKQLSSGDIGALISTPDPLTNLDPSNPASHLSKILIPRPSDSDNNTLVQNYIKTTLNDLSWYIEEDSFTDETPLGTKRFTNIIATKDPNATRRVILSAHFDSKYFPNYPHNQFVGATDSAAPCAMMLDLAQALNSMLEARSKRFEDGEEEDDDVADTTLQLVFFDGEEAFAQWTDTDSIYGARHLAEKWATTYILPNTKRRLLGPQATELYGIEHLILLDLLGAPSPTIRNYYTETAWLFDAMASAERRLGDGGFLAYDGNNAMSSDIWKSWFIPLKAPMHNFGHIGDDHVPFLKKGVSILHVIAEPFPADWHTLKDDANALDLPTMRRWNLIFRVFMSEYLHLRPEDVEPRREPIRRLQSELIS